MHHVPHSKARSQPFRLKIGADECEQDELYSNDTLARATSSFLVKDKIEQPSARGCVARSRPFLVKSRNATDILVPAAPNLVRMSTDHGTRRQPRPRQTALWPWQWSTRERARLARSVEAIKRGYACEIVPLLEVPHKGHARRRRLLRPSHKNRRRRLASRTCMGGFHRSLLARSGVVDDTTPTLQLPSTVPATQ